MKQIDLVISSTYELDRLPEIARNLIGLLWYLVSKQVGVIIEKMYLPTTIFLQRRVKKERQIQ